MGCQICSNLERKGSAICMWRLQEVREVAAKEARGSETTNLQLAKQSSNALTHYGGDDDEEDDDASW